MKTSVDYSIGLDNNEIKLLAKKYVLTPFVLATLKLRYGIDLKDAYVSKKASATAHHRITEFNISDNGFRPEDGNALLQITIEIPKDEKFISENTVMHVYFYLKNKGRNKGISELVNVRLTPDTEATQYKLQDLLQKIGDSVISKLQTLK